MLLCLVSCKGCKSTPVTPVEPVPVPATPPALNLGWNLGNQLDAFYTYGEMKDMPDENCWGSPSVTQATIDGVKAAGFTSIRIPITWLRKIGPSPDYTIDPDWMARAYEVVEYAEKAGLYAIINIHHDECNNDGHWLDVAAAASDVGKNALIKNKLTRVWTQIAEKFKDKGDFLIFESLNEIQDGGWGWSEDFQANPQKQCNILNQWNQVFVDAVRATGGNNATRWLGVPTYAANPKYAEYAQMPSDPAGKVMLAVHFYDPSPYTIGTEQYSDWGHTGEAGKKCDYGDEDYVEETFKMLNQNYVQKNVPVYIGEFGCSLRDMSDTRAWKFYLYYMEYVVKAAHDYGLPCFVWDNGAGGEGQEHHGYIDRTTGKCTEAGDAVIKTMVKAWFTDSKDYTLQSVYDAAPRI